MSLKDIDFDAAFRRLADRRIEEAMRDGKFDNLPGRGKPIELDPMPADENARATWWALRIMRRNDFTPDEVRWRKSIDYLRESLERAQDEPGVRLAVARINELVRKVNTLGTNALQAPVVAVSLEGAMERFRERLSLVPSPRTAGGG
jgi:hypothetical protein